MFPIGACAGACIREVDSGQTFAYASLLLIGDRNIPGISFILRNRIDILPCHATPAIICGSVMSALIYAGVGILQRI